MLPLLCCDWLPWKENIFPSLFCLCGRLKVDGTVSAFPCFEQYMLEMGYRGVETGVRQGKVMEYFYSVVHTQQTLN